jgi:hypothetical protein
MCTCGLVIKEKTRLGHKILEYCQPLEVENSGACLCLNNCETHCAKGGGLWILCAYLAVSCMNSDPFDD